MVREVGPTNFGSQVTQEGPSSLGLDPSSKVAFGVLGTGDGALLLTSNHEFSAVLGTGVGWNLGQVLAQ